MLRPRGINEAWPPSFHGVAVERELRHDEQLAARVDDRAVHLVFIVGENAKADDLVGHPGELLLAVGMRQANQQNGAMTDLSNHSARDSDLSALRALNKYSHRLEQYRRRKIRQTGSQNAKWGQTPCLERSLTPFVGSCWVRRRPSRRRRPASPTRHRSTASLRRSPERRPFRAPDSSGGRSPSG